MDAGTSCQIQMELQCRSVGFQIFWPKIISKLISEQYNNEIMIMKYYCIKLSYSHHAFNIFALSPVLEGCLFMSETHVRQSQIGTSGSSKSHTDWPPNHWKRQKPTVSSKFHGRKCMKMSISSSFQLGYFMLFGFCFVSAHFFSTKKKHIETERPSILEAVLGSRNCGNSLVFC